MADFIRCVCLCHDVNRVDGEDDTSFLTGGSQDELVHLEMLETEKLGSLSKREREFITICVFGEIEVYKNLRFLDFTSDRKMMTRVVQNVATGKITAYSKGADMAILPICKR